jgi:NADH:ubiquinone reductase (H+-translocating)
MSNRIVIVGGGFAGLWSAAGAARARDLFAMSADDLEIVLVAPDPYHTIRVRCYEADLAPIRVPLDTVLQPIDVRRVEARVERIDPAARMLALAGGSAPALAYDRLILAAGSHLVRPAIPLAQPTFDVDTYAGAQDLATHIAGLAGRAACASECSGVGTAVVIGGGLVGIEIACELPSRLRDAVGGAAVRVVLIDRAAIGAAMGAGADVVRAALQGLGVEVRADTTVQAVDADGVVLGSGERIAAATVIFATGMSASPLTRDLGVACDALGRVAVDRFLRVTGVAGAYAAGDCAAGPADEVGADEVGADDVGSDGAGADGVGHVTVMSCQHARPMGRLAGHNAVCDIAGRLDERASFAAPDYVTVLDLGPHGALYTAGWDRDTVVASGAEAKATKRTINASRIYPPQPATREAIFAAAAPAIQARPATRAPGPSR